MIKHYRRTSLADEESAWLLQRKALSHHLLGCFESLSRKIGVIQWAFWSSKKPLALQWQLWRPPPGLWPLCNHAVFWSDYRTENKLRLSQYGKCKVFCLFIIWPTFIIQNILTFQKRGDCSWGLGRLFEGSLLHVTLIRAPMLIFNLSSSDMQLRLRMAMPFLLAKVLTNENVYW